MLARRLLGGLGRPSVGACAGWTGQELPAALAAGGTAAQELQPHCSSAVPQLCRGPDPAPLHALARHLQGCALLQETVLLQVTVQIYCCMASTV